MRGVSLLLAVVACDAPPKPAPAPAPERQQQYVSTSTSIELRWSDVVTNDGCFYFSGPDGRDDRLQGIATLERKGPAVRLRVGGADFEGTYRAGKLTLFRVSPHEFDGAWLAFERIDGIYTEKVMRGTYRYHECQTDGPCPGRCEIRADLVLAR